MNGYSNLRSMFERADKIDREEGELAYYRYHQLMRALADKYGFSVTQVTTAFVSLSPNNDYEGNLRSLVSVLEGVRKGEPPERITVSTYRHCLDRAYLYLTGRADFWELTKGPKIFNFCKNIIDPTDNRYVTVDGHISNIWAGTKGTVKGAIIRSIGHYHTIANAIKELAFEQYLLPNQYQAILWFARKRVENIKYDPQRDLFDDPTDCWRTLRDVNSIESFTTRVLEEVTT